MKRSEFSYWTGDPIDLQSLVHELSEVGEIIVGSAREIDSVYFDTFDWRLFEAGKSLSVRNATCGPFIDLFEDGRPVAIATCAGRLPSGFVTDLPAGCLSEQVERAVDVRRLLPRLAVTSTATPISVLDKEGKIVLRVLHERLVCRHPNAGDEMALGVQMTLQPVRGYAKPLAGARRALDRMRRCDPHDGLLVVKGLRAIGQRPGDYSSKLRLDLNPGMPAGTAARYIHLALLDAMQDNEQGTIRDIDSEFLHDFRVAVRRTRSALSQIDKHVLPKDVITAAKDDFRWIGQLTGRMRDLDVYLIAFPAFKEALPADYQSSLDPFHDYLTRQARIASRRVAVTVRGRRYRRICDNWRRYLTETEAAPEDGKDAMRPVKVLADVRIWKTYRRLMREGEAIDDASPPAALHDLRITGKKLRYLLEFFNSLYPNARFGNLVGALKKLQNVLGEFQDAEVQSHSIRQFAREMSQAGTVSVETQMAMGMIADTTLRRVSAARSAFRDCFANFSQDKVRKNFTRLFKT
jgi:CHAD domain-containing protein